MRTRINLTFFVVFLAVLFICAAAQAAISWEITSIGYGFNPQIYGKKIVWQSGGEIYLYDAQEEFPSPVLISSTDSYGNSNPQIYGDYICWVGVDYDHIVKVFLDDVNDVVPCIALNMNDGTNPQAPQISDKLVVWYASDGTNYEIYAYDIATSSTDKLTNDGYDNQNPQVSGYNIAWEADDQPYYISLFFYDALANRMVKVREVEGADNWHPQIYDDTIAWWGGVIYPDPIWYKLELFMFDESDDYEPVKITEYYGQTVLVYPQIWGKNIVWENTDQPCIDFYDGITEEITHISSTCNYTFYPQLWDNKVVWEGLNELWNYEVYFWDGDTPGITYPPLSDSGAQDHAPQIYESDVVWHTDTGVIYFAEAEVLLEGSDIDVSPLTYDFGEVWVDVTETTTITISNEGDEDLTISDIYLRSGTLNNDFSIRKKPRLPMVLEPDASVELTIVYKPSSDVLSTDILEIISDDPDEELVEVSLSGEGILYRDIAVFPMMYDFGEVQINESATTTVTISNVGNLLLTVDAIDFQESSSSDFTIVPEIDPNDLPFVLRTRGSRTSVDIEIEFSPSDPAGEKSAVLEIYSNDPDENPVEVSLIGTGIE